MTASKLEHALSLAQQGFRVFPLGINAKTPVHSANWRKTATTDPTRIREMWTEPMDGVAMDYNIGIALGEHDLVVDVDVRDGKPGKESLQLLEAIYGPLPATWVIVTASGGEHRYYRLPHPVTLKAQLAPGIDLKRHGGFVVGPGSTIDGRLYRAFEDEEPYFADAPEWLLEHAAAREREKTHDATPLVDLDSDHAIHRATEWLLDHAPEATEGAGGDHATFTVAARVKDFGVSEPMCVELMLDHWNVEKAHPPWDADALADKIGNAYRYGQNAPGVASAEAEFDAVEIDRKDPPASEIPLQWVEPFDAGSIPPRRWVLGRYLARQFLSGLISPPGVGKTTFLLMVAVAVASGRDDIAGFKVHDRTRVLLWNQEDEHDELRRRLLAIMTAFDVSWSDLTIDGRPAIVLGSGVDRPLIFAARDASGSIRIHKDAGKIEAFIREHGIGLAIFDPFVELHGAAENDNVEIAAVGRAFRRIAVKAECSVALAHHTRKPREAEAGGYAGDMNSARGAGALNGVARMVATLYGMDKDTAKKYGIGEDDARRYIRFDDAKNNLAAPGGEPLFLKREGVTIGGFGGEEVGVLRPTHLVKVPPAAQAERDLRVKAIIGIFDDRESDRIRVEEIGRVMAGLDIFIGTEGESHARTIRRWFIEEKTTAIKFTGMNYKKKIRQTRQLTFDDNSPHTLVLTVLPTEEKLSENGSEIEQVIEYVGGLKSSDMGSGTDGRKNGGKRRKSRT